MASVIAEDVAFAAERSSDSELWRINYAKYHKKGSRERLPFYCLDSVSESGHKRIPN
jgi:hypothetical protein